jgi:hypothetical protein
MSEDMALTAVYSVLCIILVASSLVARRLPLKEWLRMALAWAAIFGAAFFAVMLVGGLTR